MSGRSEIRAQACIVVLSKPPGEQLRLLHGTVVAFFIFLVFVFVYGWTCANHSSRRGQRTVRERELSFYHVGLKDEH